MQNNDDVSLRNGGKSIKTETDRIQTNLNHSTSNPELYSPDLNKAGSALTNLV